MGIWYLLGLVAILASPGFVIGALVGGWYTYSTSLPKGVGFLHLIVVVLLLVVYSFVRYRTRARSLGVNKAVLWAFSLPFIIIVREILDPINFSSTVWTQILGYVFIAFLIAFTCVDGAIATAMAFGFIAANIVYSFFELKRVLEGGVVHAPQVAFDANPIYAGHFVAISILLLFVLWRRELIGWRVAVALGAPLFGGMVALGSLGVYAGLAVGALYLIQTAGGRRSKLSLPSRWLSVGVIVVLTFVGLNATLAVRETSGNGGGVDTRFGLWAEALNVIQLNPIWGAGSSLIFEDSSADGKAIAGWYPHNIFLETWALYGVLSFVVLVAVCIIILRSLAPVGRSILLASITFFSLSGTLSASFNFWVGVGFAFVASRVTPVNSDSSIGLDGPSLRLRPHRARLGLQ